MADVDNSLRDASPSATALSSTQLNIVTILDVAKILRTDSIENAAAMMDNSAGSIRKGTPQLATLCRQGQALNWLIYCMDMRQRPDGTWPPFARIANIAFLEDEQNTRMIKTCADMKIYGGPDAMRNPYVPVYSYWAGTVIPDLEPGEYKYRLIIECETDTKDKKKYYNLDGPSLQVVGMADPLHHVR